MIEFCRECGVRLNFINIHQCAPIPQFSPVGVFVQGTYGVYVHIIRSQEEYNLYISKGVLFI